MKLASHLNSGLVCKYFWFLSDFDDPDILNKVKGLFPDKELKALAREKDSAAQLPGSIYCDYVINVVEGGSLLARDVYTSKTLVDIRVCVASSCTVCSVFVVFWLLVLLIRSFSPCSSYSACLSFLFLRHGVSRTFSSSPT